MQGHSSSRKLSCFLVKGYFLEVGSNPGERFCATAVVPY